MPNSKQHWLHRISSRWGQEVQWDQMDQLKVRPEVEAFKVWLAQVALPLVAAQGRVQSRKRRVDRSGQTVDEEIGVQSEDEYLLNAARLDLIAMIVTELETMQQDKTRFLDRE